MANVRNEIQRDVSISGEPLKTVAPFAVVKYWIASLFPKLHSWRESRPTEDVLSEFSQRPQDIQVI